MRKYERIDYLIKRLQKEFNREHEEELQGTPVLEIVEETDLDDNEVLDFNIHIVDSEGTSIVEGAYATIGADDEANQLKVFKELTIDRGLNMLV